MPLIFYPCKVLKNFKQSLSLFILLILSFKCYSYSFYRNSIAYDSNLVLVDINQPRTETICESSMTNVAVDYSVPRCLLDIDGNTIIATDTSGTSLYTTMNGGRNWTTLISSLATDTNFSSDWFSGIAIITVKVLSPDVWLITTGSGVAVGQQGYIYKTTNAGAKWTKVLTLSRGVIGLSSWYNNVIGNEIVVGEYGNLNQSDNPRRIYYSSDLGDTWNQIYAPDAQSGQHCHFAAFGGNDTNCVYMSYGDATGPFAGYAKLAKLTFNGGNKSDGNNWTASTILKYVQPTSVIYNDGFLYFGHDGGSASVLDGLIFRLNLSDDSITPVLKMPASQPYGAPYADRGSDLYIFGLCEYNDVYYAAAYQQVPGGNKWNGIYASVDLLHWTCIFRNNTAKGIYYIAGYWNGCIYGTWYDNYGNKYLCKFPPVTTSNTAAIYAERSITNKLNTAAKSTFAPGNGWVPYFDVNYSDCGIDSNTYVVDKQSYRVVLQNWNYHQAAFYSYPIWTWFSPTDRLAVTAWVKTSSNWPENALIQMSINNYAGLSVATAYVNNIRGVWQPYTCYANVIGMPSNYEFINFTVNTSNISDWSNPPCFWVDAVGAFADNINLSDTFQIGGTPRAQETLTYDTNAANCLNFVWYPKYTSREIDSPIYIGYVTDGNSYINFIYDDANSAVLVSDGTNSANIGNVKFERNEIIYFSFSLQDGLMNFACSGASFSGADSELTSLSSFNKTVFGTDYSMTNGSVGAIADVNIYSTLSFNNPPSGILNLPLGFLDCWLSSDDYCLDNYDLNLDGIVNFIDYASLCE